MNEKTELRETETVHGSVEYEVVPCGCCGAEVAKNDARRFVIGDIRERGGRRVEEVDSQGWVCEMCSGDPERLYYPSGSVFLPSISIGSLLTSITVWTITTLVLNPPRAVAGGIQKELNLAEHDKDM
jgi:hypothetical protein